MLILDTDHLVEYQKGTSAGQKGEWRYIFPGKLHRTGNVAIVFVYRGVKLRAARHAVGQQRDICAFAFGRSAT